LQKYNPGIKIKSLDKIGVFGNNIDFIKETIESFGGENNKIKFSNYESLKSRPYIIVSYANPNNNKASRLIILNPRSRGLTKAKEQYKDAQVRHKQILKDTKLTTEAESKKAREEFSKEEFPVLISR